MAALALRLRDLAADSLADAQVYRDLIDLSLAKKPKDDAKLRIIGAGFSRTATLSMYAALMELGYKVSIAVVDAALVDRILAYREYRRPTTASS
jgi:hypothetical protein